MPIPASGAISMSMFNTILGRVANRADSRLASASVPWSGSLFWLANQSGTLNQTAPHSMGEWYGYNTASAGVTVYPAVDRIGDGGTGCVDGVNTFNIEFTGTVPGTTTTFAPTFDLSSYYRRTGASFINSGSDLSVDTWNTVTNCNA